MPRAAVAVAVVVIVAGLAVVAPGYLTRERDYVAVTPQAPPLVPPASISVPGHDAACMNLVALDSHSAQARFSARTRGPRAMPLELTLTGPGYRARARIPARYADGQMLRVPVRPPPRSLVATACVRNLGTDLVSLAAVIDRSRSRSAVNVNGVPTPAGFVLTFYERKPTSILSRLGVSLRRMDVLRPGVVAPATLWLLLALFLAGLPVAAVWAFARALRIDEAAEAERPA